MEMETASKGESCQKTRSSKMNVAPYGSIIHLKSTDHLDQQIIEFNRSKYLDDAVETGDEDCE